LNLIGGVKKAKKTGSSSAGKTSMMKRYSWCIHFAYKTVWE